MEPHTPLLDSSTGVWCPAGESQVIRFIVEELHREDRVPEGMGWEALQGDVEALDLPAPPPAVERPPEAQGSGGADGWDLGLTLADSPVGDSSPGSLELTPIEPTLPPDAPSPPKVGPADPPDAAPEPPPPPSPPPSPPETPSKVQFSDWMTSSMGAGLGFPEQPEPEVEEEMEKVAPAPPPAPSRGMTFFRLAFLSTLALAAVGVFVLSQQEWDLTDLMGMHRAPVGTAVVATQLENVVALPTPPVGMEDEVASVLQAIRVRFAAVTDSLRVDAGIGPAPPADWLSGRYLGGASAFPSVGPFWGGYLSLVETIRGMDRRLYFETVRDHASALPDGGVALNQYFLERYQALTGPRMERFTYLAAAARSALELHAFLLEFEDEIRYTPAMGEALPLDPVLEAGSTNREVQEALTNRLDALLRALDRSRMGGIPAPEGLSADLFERFGEG